MFIKREDLEILKDIELYLYNKNIDKLVLFDKMFAINKEDIGDKEALDLYFKLYSIIENLESKRKENNKRSWSRIKNKRKGNKNYGRKKLETGKYC